MALNAKHAYITDTREAYEAAAIIERNPTDIIYQAIDIHIPCFFKIDPNMVKDYDAQN